jgi:hypothetical protein
MVKRYAHLTTQHLASHVDAFGAQVRFDTGHIVYTLGIWGGAQMPWKECKRMDERLRFVARLLEREKMAALCREFGISRPTGYKIFTRYKSLGLEGLLDRSRRP